MIRQLTARVVVTVTVLHGLLHLVGAANGLGWARVDELTEQVDVVRGTLWLLATALVLVAAGAMALRRRGWWILAAVAAVFSQLLVFSAWSDAWAGTIANVFLLVAAAYGLLADGPTSSRARFRRLEQAALAETPGDNLVTETDLARLPQLVATYVRLSGAVGEPRVRNFRAQIHGRIRGGVDAPWMRFTGEQVNTYGDHESRMLFMDATMKGLPVDVLHVYADDEATMDARLLSAVPVMHGAGPEMTRAETVTLFNDLCVMAPGALVDAPVVWDVLDAHRVRGTYTHGAHTVSAVLVFDGDGWLVDFVSDDRLRASSDGRSFTVQRWSTPLHGRTELGGHRLAAVGEARWHAPAPEGTFDYLEFVVDDLEYNVTV